MSEIENGLDDFDRQSYPLSEFDVRSRARSRKDRCLHSSLIFSTMIQEALDASKIPTIRPAEAKITPDNIRIDLWGEVDFVRGCFNELQHEFDEDYLVALHTTDQQVIYIASDNRESLNDILRASGLDPENHFIENISLHISNTVEDVFL
jgi:hypothetical protein